ncbi:di-trans,poly-cis-decaprenylcistransferase [Roseomonas terrae]|jgi:undecaprenyl diphosphate synthase|uniref:Isoprenyl transferase n=1 Tax=Neoroseomonas terrae TaxID=424799 RepID=A0ABS5EHA7_9PROT|nr:polyprenyl diphosphate synthase [Neoroseomonas terrae]MBR0650406.1 di-trans,poly-cis-decaprenylcistransferase [Neoroseomonas terrae]
MSAASGPAREAAGPAEPPTHVAIIMDGNRRWAQARGLPVALGHKAGAEAVRRTIEAAADQGVTWLTLFAFSSENWRRPLEEVSALTGLLRLYLRSEVASLVKEGVRLRVIGDYDRFGPEMTRSIRMAEEATAGGTRLNLNVALSYGARDEILAAVRAAARAAAEGRLTPEAIDEAAFGGFLQTAGIPDPDLIIRTSGEQRLSNFLLWQAAYAEFVFQDVLWPDYDSGHLAEAVGTYVRRERRYGARP